jgi:hypothetical protein
MELSTLTSATALEREVPTSLVGAESVANALGIALSTVRKYARTGRLPVQRIPGIGPNTAMLFDPYAVVERITVDEPPAEALATSRRLVIAMLDHHATRNGKATMPEQVEALLAHLPEEHPLRTEAGLEAVDLAWDGLGNVVLTSGPWTWSLAADGDLAVATRTRPDGLRDVVTYCKGRRTDAGTATSTN